MTQNKSSATDILKKQITDDQMANAFAMCLLMPEKLFLEQVEANTNETNRVNLQKIAEYFNVTISDVAYRGRMLGLFKSILD